MLSSLHTGSERDGSSSLLGLSFFVLCFLFLVRRIDHCPVLLPGACVYVCVFTATRLHENT